MVPSPVRRVALALAVILGGAPSVSAQPPTPTIEQEFSRLPTCMQEQYVDPFLTRDPFGNVAAPGESFFDLQTDSMVPQAITPEHVLRGGVLCAHQFARIVIMPTGRALLTSLLIIMTVWFGANMAFSGRFDMTAVINKVFLFGFAVLLMDGFDHQDNLWGDRSFPQMIYVQGEMFSQPVIRSSLDSLNDGLALVFNPLDASADGVSFDSSFLRAVAYNRIFNPGFALLYDIGGFVSRWTRALNDIQSLLVGLFEAAAFVGMLLFAIIPMLILYCAYLWAYIGIMVAVIAGPLFIPFVLVEQLDFLFWGWIKSLIKLTLHMIVASILFMIVVEIAQLPLHRLSAQLSQQATAVSGVQPPDDSIFGFASIIWSSLATYVPLVFLMFMVCGKTQEMVSMITEGGGMPGSGWSGTRQQLGSAYRASGARALVGSGAGGMAAIAGGAAGGISAAVTSGAQLLGRLLGRK